MCWFFVCFDRLVEVLKRVNAEVHRMFKQMLVKYMETHKPVNTKSNNGYKTRIDYAEEIMIHELINTYH